MGIGHVKVGRCLFHLIPTHFTGDLRPQLKPLPRLADPGHFGRPGDSQQGLRSHGHQIREHHAELH